MRCFGMPVVPPVSKILNGWPLNCRRHPDLGLQVAQPFVLKVRELSITSANELISLRGIEVLLRPSSQNGQPVSGEKCQR